MGERADEHDMLAVWAWMAGTFAAVGWALSAGGVKEGVMTSELKRA